MVPFIRPGFRWSAAAILLALLAGNMLAITRAQVVEEPSDPPVPSVARGQRVFTCAHSFHGFVYRILGEMAKAAGVKDHQSVGSSMIGGSRVIQHWDVPEEKNEA